MAMANLIWILVILGGLGIGYIVLKDYFRDRKAKKSNDLIEIKSRIKKEIAEEFEGKSPEEKAKIFNERMKEFRK